KLVGALAAHSSLRPPLPSIVFSFVRSFDRLLGVPVVFSATGLLPGIRLIAVTRQFPQWTRCFLRWVASNSRRWFGRGVSRGRTLYACGRQEHRRVVDEVCATCPFSSTRRRRERLNEKGKKVK